MFLCVFTIPLSFVHSWVERASIHYLCLKNFTASAIMAECGSLRIQSHEIIINATSTSRVYGVAQLNFILDTTRSLEPHGGQFAEEQVPRSYHRNVTQDGATAVHGDPGDGITMHRVKTIHTNHHNHCTHIQKSLVLLSILQSKT